MSRRFLAAVLTVLIVIQVAAVPVAAFRSNEPDDSGDDEGGDTIIRINVDAIVSAVEAVTSSIKDFTDGFKETLVDIGLTIFVKPAHWVVTQLSNILTVIMVTYPDVRQQEVLDLHWLVYRLTLLLAVPAFVWLGFEHMTGRRDGIRPTVEVMVLLVLGGVSPWLLYYPIELSRLAAVALQPANVPIVGFLSMSVAVALLIWIEAILLLILVIIFATKNFYLMFYVAASPLIFLLSYFKPTQGHMSNLTGLFIGFLLISPLDLIAYRLVLVMLNVDSAAGSEIPEFVWGVAGLFVLIGIPWVLLQSGSALAAPAMMFSRKASTKVGEQVKPMVRERYGNVKQAGVQRASRAKNRFLEERPAEVELDHGSKNEVRLRRIDSRIRRAGNTMRNRLRDDKPEVLVHENWRQTENGDWTKETGLEEPGGD